MSFYPRERSVHRFGLREFMGHLVSLMIVIRFTRGKSPSKNVELLTACRMCPSLKAASKWVNAKSENMIFESNDNYSSRLLLLFGLNSYGTVQKNLSGQASAAVVA
jgi:hypothetical protein